jgi:hypothetical protein
MTLKNIFPFFLICMGIISNCGLFVPVVVVASSFTTNTFLDTSDIILGDGLCADSAGMCSLRAGVEETNALAGVDTLNVSAGTYLVGANLIISDNLYFVGSGLTTTILKPNINASSVLRIGAQSTISGITIDGDNNCNNGLVSYGIGEISITDIAILNCFNGLVISSNDVILSNSKFSYNRIGITVNESNFEASNIESSNNQLGISVYNSNSSIAQISNSKINNSSNTNSSLINLEGG